MYSIIQDIRTAREEADVITLYMKNRPWNGQPRADYVHVLSQAPERLEAFRVDGGRLATEPVPSGYLKQYGAW